MFARSLLQLLLMLLAVSAAPAFAGPEKTKEQQEREEREKREKSLFGNLSALSPTQQQLSKVSALGNKNASTLSKLMGGNSIRNGIKHIRHGRVSHNRPEVRTGYFEVLQGILGLVAAGAASSISDKDDSNASKLANLNGMTPSSPALEPSSGASGAAGSSMGGKDSDTAASRSRNWSEVRAELARDADAKSAFAEIEEEYGIKQEDILADLEAGKDGRKLIVNAEKNAEEPDDATASLKELRAAIAASAAAEGAGALAAGLASSGPSRGPASVADFAGAGKAVSKGRGLRDRLSRDLASLDDNVYGDEVAVSPEVREALEAKENEEARLREREARAYHEATLFDMVRGKYKEREAQIRGWIKPAVLEASTH